MTAVEGTAAASTMKVVMPGDGTVTIVEREIPEPVPLEALVRVTAVSFCSADLIRLGRPW